MAKDKNNDATAAAADGEGFQELDTGVDYASSGTWAEPKPGDVYAGKLVDVLLIPGEKSGDKPRVAYVVDEGTGEPCINIGEKAALRCLRDLRLGSEVKITFKHKEALDDNRDVWRINVQAKPNGDRKAVQVTAKLKKLYEAMDALPF